MIHATQRKLREAGFFLERISNAVHTPGHGLPEVVAFYFSAFLAAARSVTFVLQAEEKDRYAAWFPTWLSARSDSDRDLLKRFTLARNEALKRRTPDLEADHQLATITLGPYGNDVPLGVQMLWLEEEVPIPGNGVFKFSFAPDQPGTDVIPECSGYFRILAALVQDFLAAHD